MNVLGLILAGGQARRMGGVQKGLVRLGEKTLLDRVTERLRPQVDALALNVNVDDPAFSATRLPILKDQITGFAGPLAGIHTGLDYARSYGFDLVLTVAVDTPFFPTDLATKLSAPQTKIALAGSEDESGTLWAQPTFGLWEARLADHLMRDVAAGTHKIVAYTDQFRAPIVPFEANGIDPFFNVNSLKDLAQAETLLAEGAR